MVREWQRWGEQKYLSDDIFLKERVAFGGGGLKWLTPNNGSSSAVVHGRPRLTNDVLCASALTGQLCARWVRPGLTWPTVPLPAGFWLAGDSSPAPVLSPSASSAAPSARDGSSLYKCQSAPAARGWTTGKRPRCHSSTDAVRKSKDHTHTHSQTEPWGH